MSFKEDVIKNVDLVLAFTPASDRQRAREQIEEYRKQLGLDGNGPVDEQSGGAK